MRLAVLLHEARALGLPPAPPSFAPLKKMQLKWETEIAWLKRALASIERAQGSWRSSNPERAEKLKGDIFARLKGPIFKLADSLYSAADAYVSELHREPYGVVSKLHDIMALPTTVGGVIGQIRGINAPDLMAFSVSHHLVPAMEAVSLAISAAGARYSD